MKQPWIYSARMDGAFILAPALVISVVLWLASQSIAAQPQLSPWMWGVLIVGVDVAHVYSTLYRTYADREEFLARQSLYVLAPLLTWIAGTLLYSISALTFWRAITYLAVIHFVRQQYGFMMMYGRKERAAAWEKRLDKAAIYLATLYPLLYWHTHLPRKFEWFMEGDFIALPWGWLATLAAGIYALTLIVYVVKETREFITHRRFNIPKNLLLLGTALSWWTGIVYFDNDIAFTAANVLAHGIPYLALLWIYGRNLSELSPEKRIFGFMRSGQFFSLKALPLFLGLLVLLAYIEEGLWDAFIWTEHSNQFRLFRMLPAVESNHMLTWLVPLLALPQMTHYVLDAFIWRLRTPDTNWKKILFHKTEEE